MAAKRIVEPCGESDVYREEILDHSRNPRNKRRPDEVTLTGKKANLSCGDTVTFHVHVGEDGLIDKVGFEGLGCAISMAATSMLTEEVIGKDLDAVLKMGLEDVSRMLGAEIGPTRVRCAMLGLETLKRGIEEYRNGN